MQEVPFSIAMDYHHRRNITSSGSEEIANGSGGTKKSCKVSILKCAGNIVLCFGIVYVVGLLYENFVTSLRGILVLTIK